MREALRRTYNIRDIRKQHARDEVLETTRISTTRLQDVSDLTWQERVRLAWDLWPLLLLLLGILASVGLIVGTIWMTFFHGEEKINSWFLAATGLHLAPTSLLLILGSILYVFYMALSGYRLLDTTDLGYYSRIAGSTVLPFFVLLLIGVVFRAWRNHWRVLDNTDVLWVQLFFLTTLLGFGATAYSFKRANKLYYGVSETGVALISTWFLVARAIPSLHPSHDLKDWVALATAIYLFSRGVGNTIEGIEEKTQRFDQERAERKQERRAALLASSKSSEPNPQAAGDLIIDPTKKQSNAEPDSAGKGSRISIVSRHLFGQALLDAAEMDDVDAMRWLASDYQCGFEVPRNLAQARRWYERCAEAGDVESMRALGDLYQRAGDGEDLVQSNFWFKAAATHGDHSSMYELGNQSLLGFGTAIDYRESIRWYERAAEGGQMYAMFWLGELHRTGQGVEKDEAIARTWFERASALGERHSMKALGDLLWLGRGGPRDYCRAKHWYREVARLEEEATKSAEESAKVVAKAARLVEEGTRLKERYNALTAKPEAH